MYEIVMRPNNNWMLVIQGQARFMGSFKNVMKICIRELKIDSKQLEAAVEELCRNEAKGHDTMHFGVYKTFMFSYDSKEEFRKKAV